ncbi:DUF3853 family protein [Elizabethkingia meningoseptica]|uniref:DUF3853 family protein n=1 Tax=Elizabethkingia meningoseptica TaxID=238 RepID=UPI00136647CF|nr:DUF3853 family protein [Elizabethkingia meningoseptica]MVW93688.1 DUF3853 family protein [Elizabethkingia meningoseptica]
MSSLVVLTSEQLEELTENIVSKTIERLIPNNDDTEKYFKGIKGLAGALGCSVTKAQAIKNTGYLDNALSFIGNRISGEIKRVQKEYKENQFLIAKTIIKQKTA